MYFIDVDSVDPKLVKEKAVPKLPLPPFLRSTGVMPDLDSLKVGDIILYSPKMPGLTANAIRSHQSRKYGQNTAESGWTHVSIYIGDAQVCEAVRRGVVVSSFYDALKGQTLRVRRPVLENDHGGYMTAIFALTQMSRPYNYRQILSFIFDTVGGAHIINPVRTQDSKIKSAYTCSNLCETAFQAAHKGPLTNDPRYRTSPADIAASDVLVDIEVPWVRIPPSTLPKAAKQTPTVL